MPHKNLTEDETRIIVHKGTESPFLGKYVHHKQSGTYTCRRCAAPLFHSSAKFDSKTGWPSFDDAVPGATFRVQSKTRRSASPETAAAIATTGHPETLELLSPNPTRFFI